MRRRRDAPAARSRCRRRRSSGPVDCRCRRRRVGAQAGVGSEEGEEGICGTATEARLAGREAVVKHRHHIIPKHAGGTDEPENLTPPISIRLHAMFHLDRYKNVGDALDLIACRSLLGAITSEEARIATLRLVLKGRTYSEETIALMRAAQRRRSIEGRMPRMSEAQKAAQRVYRRAHPETFAAMHAAVGESNRRRRRSKASALKHRRSLRAYWKSEAGLRRREQIREQMKARRSDAV